MFKADSNGIAYVVEKVHSDLGDIESCQPRDNGKIGEREWSIKRFERLEEPCRYVRVVGDCSGPQVQSIDDVLEIAGRCEEVEQKALDQIIADPAGFPFVTKEYEIICFEMLFFDRGDSSRYSAHVTYYVPDGQNTSYGKYTESHGDGEFEVIYDMRNLQIVERRSEVDSEKFFNIGCLFVPLWAMFIYLLPFVLICFALVLFFKLIGMLAE